MLHSIYNQRLFLCLLLLCSDNDNKFCVWLYRSAYNNNRCHEHNHRSYVYGSDGRNESRGQLKAVFICLISSPMGVLILLSSPFSRAPNTTSRSTKGSASIKSIIERSLSFAVC
jgi:hypothetical protein